MSKIIDEFTDLPVSRQRKHQLRHPELAKQLQKNYYRNNETRRQSVNERAKQRYVKSQI